MLAFLTRYVAVLLPFVVIDMIWLSRMAPRFYKPIMGDIALAGFQFAPAIAFYLMFPVGVVLFVLTPALKAQSLVTALIFGALFGLFTYGTYDLTNQATLRNWTWSLSLTDMAWGGFLTAISAAVAYLALTRLHLA